MSLHQGSLTELTCGLETEQHLEAHRVGFRRRYERRRAMNVLSKFVSCNERLAARCDFIATHRRASWTSAAPEVDGNGSRARDHPSAERLKK
jgi:hypothetical protein